MFGVGRVDGNGNLDTAFGNGGYSLTEFGRRPSEGVDMGASNVAPRLDGYIAGGAAPTALGFVGFTAAGQLDPAFGQGGKLALDPDPPNDPIVLSRLVPLGGGRTLAVCFTFAERSGKPTRGILVVIRADGTLDPSFGSRGNVVLTGRKLGIEAIDSLTRRSGSPTARSSCLEAPTAHSTTTSAC